VTISVPTHIPSNRESGCAWTAQADNNPTLTKAVVKFIVLLLPDPACKKALKSVSS
jgi:hypothetical protein